MTCCVNPYFLGCIDACSSVTLPIVAEQTGTYRFEWTINGELVGAASAFSAGQNLWAPPVFNESGLTIFQIRQPDGELLEFADENDEPRRCFALRVQTLKLVEVEISPDGEPYP